METYIPRPPPIPPPKASFLHSYNKKVSGKPFHLTNHEDGDTGSIYSIYKQKIDSMFDSSDSPTHSELNNNVQAKIEQMFSEIASDPEIKTNDTEDSLIGTHNFSIDYLGSVPLAQKVTSLAGLQQPLKELYFAYKKSSKHKQLTGKLEISPSGLKVFYQGQKGDLEQLNPFPSIAVWSAVKFVLQSKSQNENFYAFLPLITDPDQLDKQTLFKDLSELESKYIVNQNHAPLFAVVMRKIGLTKNLECHAFICQTSEDAIVIAATLYKSLMSHMKSRDKQPKNRNGVSCMSISSSFCADSIQNIPVRPPRKKKSTTNSLRSTNTSTLDKICEKTDAKSSIKKPKHKKLAPSTPNSQREKNLDEILPCPYEEPFKVSQSPEEDSTTQLKRTRSLRRQNSTENLISKSTDSGDILTKVTIPRSGSFLNAGGLTRYKSKVNRTNGQPGGSPLGFSELFQEFRLQEGLSSMDDILAVIINSEGMSFNDLKPIYKEFLLKLAVTLTKDELYQRSKSIMRRQKKKNMRREDRRIIGVKGLKRVFRKSFRLNISKRLKRKKYKHISSKTTPASISTVKQEKSLPESSISTSSVDTRPFRPKTPNKNVNTNNLTKMGRKQSYRKKTKDIKAENARIRREGMSTSEDSDFFTMKRNKKTSPAGANQNRNSSSGYVSCSECSYDSDTCTCVSADKCYCSLGNRLPNSTKVTPKSQIPKVKCGIQRPKTAQSCHSTSCLSEERCYCSLNEMYDDLTISGCACDTDSCAESNKCYCNFNNKEKGTIFEQLKRRGFIPNAKEEIVTPPNQRKKLCKKYSNTKSTKSVEYISNPKEKYYEKLLSVRQRNFDYTNGQILEKYNQGIQIYEDSRRNFSKEHINTSFNEDVLRGSCRDFGCHQKFWKESQQFVRSNSMYEKAMSEVPRSNLAQCSVRSFKSYNEATRRGKTLQATVPANSSTEALSVKKSAEIAALFTDLKLSQTTDITHLISPNFNKNTLNSCNISASSLANLTAQLTSTMTGNYSESLNQNFSGNFATSNKFGFNSKNQINKKAIVTPYKHISNGNLNAKMVQNSLYARGLQTNGKMNKNSLYSARNGLYTIQSQSDSSCSDNRNDGIRNGNQNLENTLGYLP